MSVLDLIIESPPSRFFASVALSLGASCLQGKLQPSFHTLSYEYLRKSIWHILDGSDGIHIYIYIPRSIYSGEEISTRSHLNQVQPRNHLDPHQTEQTEEINHSFLL